MVYQVLSSIFSNTTTHNIAFESNESRQAAVTFQVMDGGIYRIARDYQKEAWHLSQMDTGTKKFKTLETDRSAIFQWLKKKTGGFSENERRLVFMMDRLRLPSYSSHSSGNQEHDPILAIYKSPSPAVQGLDPFPKKNVVSEEERIKVEKALKEAEKELDAMTEVEDRMLLMQDEAAAIRKRILFSQETEEKINRMEAIKTEKYRIFSSEGMINAEQEKAYQNGENVLNMAFDELEGEANSLEAELILKHQPKGKNVLLIIGLVTACVSLFLPFVVTLLGPSRFIFLAGFIGGSALAVFSYFKHARLMAARKKLEDQLSALKERGRQLEKKFEKEHADVLRLVEKTGVKDLPELKAQQQMYLNLMEKKETAIKKIEEALSGETLEGLEEKAQALGRDVTALQAKLQSHQVLSEEVYRLQENLREFEQGQESSEPSITAFPDAELTAPGFPVSDSNSKSAHFSDLFNISGATPEQRRKRLERDAGIIYRRFRPKNTRPIRLNEKGEIFVGETPLKELSDGMADQVFLSLSLSAISQFSAISFPILIDDPFIVLDHNSKETAIKILEIISKKRQVILFTAHPESSEIGHTFELASGY